MAEKGNFLPFERGMIYQDWNTGITGTAHGLLGSEVNSTDFDRPIAYRHNMGVDEVLVILRNSSGSAIDRTDGGRFFRLATADSSSFGKIAGTAVRGGAGFALDDCYTGTSRIPNGCDAYFVKKGLTRVRCHTTPGTITPYVSRLRIATNGHVGVQLATSPITSWLGVAAQSSSTGGRVILALIGYDVPMP